MLPVVAAAATEPRVVIPQAKLQAHIDRMNAERREMLALRRMIDAGAVVEPGPLVAERVPHGADVEPAGDYDHDEDFGLYVGPIEQSYSLSSDRRR